MKKLGLFLIICGFFGIAGIAFADVSYTRTPSGYLTRNPIHISVSFDDFSDFGDYPDVAYWGFTIGGSVGEPSSICVSTTTKSISEDFWLPVGGKAIVVRLLGTAIEIEPPCDNAAEPTYNFEGTDDPENPIFEIISDSLYSLPMASTSDITANVGTLFSDLWVIIATACGIPLGFFVIRRVIGLF
jgi:hypothetical protein